MALLARFQQGGELPAEFALVVACCRWAFSRKGAESVHGLAKQADWAAFVRACRRHRVQGLAWHALSGLEVAVPTPVQVALGGDARAIADHGLRAARESARLAQAFRDAGLPLMFLKGLAVGSLAYGNPFLKMGWDVDVLVRPGDVASVATVLDGLGVKLEIPDACRLLRWHEARKESLWRTRDGLTIELHSRVADQPQLLPTIDAESPSQSVAIAQGIVLSTLARDELFAYLCVHGASSAWFRLKWITDLAALLDDQDSAEVGRLYDRSQQLGAARAAAQALLLAHRLYGIVLSPALSVRLHTPINRWLARVALGEMLRGEPTQRPLGTRIIHLSQFLLKPGLAFKFAELRRQAQVVAGIY